VTRKGGKTESCQGRRQLENHEFFRIDPNELGLASMRPNLLNTKPLNWKGAMALTICFRQPASCRHEPQPVEVFWMGFSFNQNIQDN
jgi:hypothetical protein